MVWFGKTDTEYRINGVCYLVSTRFAPIDIHDLKDNTISDKVKRHFDSGIADLTAFAEQDMLNTYGCLAAGKEEI